MLRHGGLGPHLDLRSLAVRAAGRAARATPAGRPAASRSGGTESHRGRVADFPDLQGAWRGLYGTKND